MLDAIITRMPEWAFYPVFIGTFLSIVLWTRFVVREHSIGVRITLSELGAQRNANYFRFVLWLCGPLFGLTMLFYIFPKLDSPLVSSLLTVTVLLELLVGVYLPVNKRDRFLHECIAYSMGALMFISTVGLTLVLPKLAWLEGSFVILLLLCMTGMLVNRRHFIFYEVSFIFISHFSMVVATIAVT